MAKNTLKIQAQALDLELSGDGEYVAEAYNAMREVVMDCFQRSLEDVGREPGELTEVSESEDESGTENPFRARRDTNPMYKAAIKDDEAVPETTEDAAETPLHTVIVGEVYHNVSIVARRQLDQSIFGRMLSARLIDRLFMNEDDQERLDKHLSFGKVLWRELTLAGQSVIDRKGGEK